MGHPVTKGSFFEMFSKFNKIPQEIYNSLYADIIADIRKFAENFDKTYAEEERDAATFGEELESIFEECIFLNFRKYKIAIAQRDYNKRKIADDTIGIIDTFVMCYADGLPLE
jgi:hypothetical protein